MFEKEKRIKRYMTNQKHRKRLERRAKSERGKYANGAYFVYEKLNENGEYIPCQPYAVKVHKGGRASRHRYFKNYSNRVIRRTKCWEVPKGNYYKKKFDFCWAVD